MFSKSCEYGIRAIVHLAQMAETHERSSLKQVAKAIDSPVAFTAKILQLLAKNGLIDSIKGPRGGYELSENELNNLKLSDVVKAIDSDKIYRGCALGLKECNEQKPCPLHFQFKTVRDDLQRMLETTSVKDLAQGLHEGIVFLKR